MKADGRERIQYLPGNKLPTYLQTFISTPSSPPSLFSTHYVIFY